MVSCSCLWYYLIFIKIIVFHIKHQKQGNRSMLTAQKFPIQAKIVAQIGWFITDASGQPVGPILKGQAASCPRRAHLPKRR